MYKRNNEEKKSANDIIVEKILENIEETKTLPWLKAFKEGFPRNNISGKRYRGVNWLLLPSGEYFTELQLREYNKKHGTDFRYQKGIKWFYVVFFKEDSREVSKEDIEKEFPDSVIDEKFSGRLGSWVYYWSKDKKEFRKVRRILRYSKVAERNFAKDSDGNILPSCIDGTEVSFTRKDVKSLIQKYLENTGIGIKHYSEGCMAYDYVGDFIKQNDCMFSEGEWFSAMFHEMAHSTGHMSRLSRNLASMSKDEYAKEECIAEICSAMLCNRFGLSDFMTSNVKCFDNSVAYIQYYRNRITDWKKDFIWVCSQAQMAYDFIIKNMGLED